MTNWQKTFLFKGKELYYNRIPYNNPSERAVEVSIGFNFLINLPNSDRVLEVGNVLSRYESSLGEQMGVIKRRIIDKFEIDIGVDNEDLMTLESEEKYDAIVSISTVEHIGQGLAPGGAYGESTEIGDHREAPLKAIAKIYDLLALEGKALITVPFGVLTDGGWYIQFSAQYLALLKKYGIPQEAIRTSFLRLINRDPTKDSVKMLWEEIEEVELSNVEYNHPFPFANAIAVIELCKVSNDFHLDLNIDPTPLFYNKPYKNRVELDQDKAQLHPPQTDLEKYNQPEYQTQAKVEIISVHVPKTAGTTFYQVLSDVYGTESVFRDNVNVPESQIKPSALPANIKVIHGHFALNKYKGYFHNAKKVIWLRNPVMRLISNYFFWRMQKVGIPRNMDVLGIVEFANLPGVRNIVAKLIGKNHLSNFYFVGLQEFFQSDLEDLKTMMGWSDISVLFTNANTFPDYDIQLRKILDDNEIVKKLAQSNSLDMELYQEALNLRAKRRNELGGFHQLLQLSEQSQSQLHQAQSQFAQSQLELHQTQGELEQSQTQLHQTQGELEQSQSQHHQTQTELAQSQSQLHQTQAVLVHSQLELHQTQAELEQSQTQLHQTQGELEQSQSQLHQTQGELEQSQSQLHQTQAVLVHSQLELHQTQGELEQSQAQLHQTQGELEQSQAQLHQTQGELEQSQAQLHQTQGELEQSQAQLHQTQGELEQS
ncbi:sulfotransferase family 2 domain-containing protein, partial [Microcoleus sp. B3-D2]|uniref:sulfotransferase family 2 domain-containing protein n=2 Tax=Microcoleus TaxID=44471 RepID=UPI002FD47EF4